MCECKKSPNGLHEIHPGSVALADDCTDTERAILDVRCRHCGMTGSAQALFVADNLQWDPDPSEET